MDKKGLIWGFVTDLIGVTFFILGLLAWLYIFTLTSRSVAFEMSNVPYSGDEVVMLSYLKTPAGDGIILDKVFDAYRYDDKKEFSSAINTSLNWVYGRGKPVCWKFWYYEGEEKKLLAEESCGETSDLFDREIIAPLPYNKGEKNIKIKLTVPGYK
ncbi:hypothetical protein ACFLZ6_01295 [Nanoarchaeota archaeon]